MKQSLDREILKRGLSDYTDIWELPRILKRIEPQITDEDVYDVVLDSIKRLAGMGLVEIGDLVRVSSSEPLVEFVRWSMAVEGAIERIETEWVKEGNNVGIGSIAWLHNTGSSPAKWCRTTFG